MRQHRRWIGLDCHLRRALLLLLVMLPVAVQAQFNYTIANGEVTITEYNGSGGAVTIPSTIAGLPVSAIVGYVFWENSAVTSVSIPNSVDTIGTYVFANCTGLGAINVVGSNQFYSSVDGVLFNKSVATLFRFPGGRTGSYSIPRSVTSIGSSAFSYSTKLTGVTVSDSVTSIGNAAFWECNNLASVTIPNSVTIIWDAAFGECSNLANVTIPNSVTSIGEWLFKNCSSLTTVMIGDSVTSIGDSVFYGCTSLSAIDVHQANLFYSSVDGVLFDYYQTTLIQYPVGRTGSYSVPNSVISIEKEAFRFCKLTSVTIPNSVTTIGLSAFRDSTSLTSVVIGDSVTSIRVWAFADSSSLTGVYFKGNAPGSGERVFRESDAVIVYYLAGTSGWGATYGERPTALWVLPVPTTIVVTGVTANQFGFNIVGVGAQVVVVEACTDLAEQEWSALTSITLNAGSAIFSDPDWASYPGRFYRVRSP